MFIGRVEISREGYIGNGYGKADPSKPFVAKIEVFGTRTKSELTLSPELSDRVVAIIAGEIADAGRAISDAMTAEVMAVAALPAPPASADDNLPF